ncbi:MAG: GNAT family N-acetyltransferase, partial [Bacteroidales bacterium]|nr:GNAT family N-acetyltransferase [Bacteroidales bacterium]
MIEYKVARAGEEDMQLVHNMAEIVFRHTYREILSSEQMEYMMDWMYSLPNLRRQLDDGHIYHIAYDGERPCGYVSVQPEGIAEDGMPLYHL